MNRRALWIALLGIALPVLAYAQPERGMGGMGGGGFGGGGGRGGWRGGRRMGSQQNADTRPVWESLGLSKDQLEKVHEIFDDQEKSSAQDRADLQTARGDLEKMMRDDEPDRSAIEHQIDKIEQMQVELQKSSAWAMLDARKLLTQQQRKKLDQVLAERRGGGREMGSPPNGFGGGGSDGGR
jgi:Spy/CpxP family protein refolding chaperone